LEDKFITTFGLKEEIKTQIKFYINGKEINKDDELMDIIKSDDIVEIKNINEDYKDDDRQKTEEIDKKDDIQEVNETKINEINKNDSNRDEISKNLDNILSKNLKKTIIKSEKNLLKKFGEKIENSKYEIINILEEKIKNLFSENDINKKLLDIDDKINKLNQYYIDFKSVKIKYFNKFIDNKSNAQDPSKVAKNEQTE
jgi:hypothetical protein